MQVVEIDGGHFSFERREQFRGLVELNLAHAVVHGFDVSVRRPPASD